MPVMPGIELRPAASHEAAEIRALVRAAYARWIPVIGREPRPMQVDYDAAILEHDFVLAIDASDGPDAGRCVGVIETERRADHLWIENVAVAPPAQGRGVGRLLLADAERRAIAAGLPELRLLTNAAFETNIRLYRMLGYSVDREEPFMNGVTSFLSKSVR